MKGLVISLGVLGIVSIMPIWRGAGHSRHDGVSLWRLLHDSTHLVADSPFGHPHLLYEDAVGQAKEAYQEALREHGS